MGGHISRGDDEIFNDDNHNNPPQQTQMNAPVNTTQQIQPPQSMPTNVPHNGVALQPHPPQQHPQSQPQPQPPQQQPQRPQQPQYAPPQQNMAPPRPQLQPNNHVVHRNLLDAAVKGITEHVQLCINAGGNIHVCDQEGKTPLHYAAVNGNVELAKLLVAHGAQLERKSTNEEKITALYTACQKGNIGIVDFLISKGANYKSPQRDTLYTPLHCAAHYNFVDICKLLIQKGAPLEARSSLGLSPLYAATFAKQFGAVKAIIEAGGNIHTKIDLGWTPLHSVAKSGTIDIATYLLEKGSNLEAQANDGLTPLLAAVQAGQASMVHFLLDKGANRYATIINKQNQKQNAYQLIPKNDQAQNINNLLTSHQHRPQQVIQQVVQQVVQPDMSLIQRQISSEMRRKERETELELKQQEERFQREMEQKIAKERERIEKLYAKNVTSTAVQLRGKRIALLIGNSDYVNTSALPGPAHDTNLIAEKLKMLGFDVTIGKNLKTKREMSGIVENFTNLLLDADEELECCFFYYAGHGLQYQGVNYLLPTEISPNVADLQPICLSLSDVVAQIGECCNSRCAQVIVIDACRNEWKKTRNVETSTGLAQMDTNGGTFLIFSTAPGTLAQDSCEESGENSPFALAMCRAMQEQTELYEMYRNVSSEVQRMTKTAQTPYLSSCLASKIVL